MSPFRPSRSTVCALLLGLCVLAPYSHLLRFNQVLLTDDGGASDAFDGELPVRAWIGDEGARWNDQLYGGLPLSNGNDTPLTRTTFGVLSPAAAEDAFLLAGLLLAAFGARAFAAALGASPTGAVFAGLAFAQSGYIVSRMRHSSIFETAVLLPWGLLAMEWLLRPRSGSTTLAGRVPGALGLAAVFGWQVLAGFPQLAYYAGLTYVAWFMLRARVLPPGSVASRFGPPLVLAGVAAAVAVLIGAPGIWPLADLAQHTPRSGTWLLNDRPGELYAPARIVGFLFPYADGDGSTLTAGPIGLYWEDYTYMGVLPFLLALGSVGGARAGSRHGVAALWTIGLLAFFFALGANTPFYAAIWHVIPGIDKFRLPTRALVVTGLALAVLAGLSLTRIEERLAEARRQRADLPRVDLLSGLVLALTLADLSAHQPRQNSWGHADTWLSVPDTARFLQQPGNEGRFYSVEPYHWHLSELLKAHGWAGDLTRMNANRSLLGPNLALYWGLHAIQGYAGATPAWLGAMWGGPQEGGLISWTLKTSDHAQPVAAPAFARLLALGHVRWVVTHAPITPQEGTPPALRLIWQGTYAGVYEVPDVLPRAWVVGTLTHVADDRAVMVALVNPFDPRHTAFTTDDVPAREPGVSGDATITADGGQTLDIDASGPGTLIVADTWYPGWVATVDGVETPIWRANLWERAIALPPGAHHVHMAFTMPKLRAARWLQALGVMLWAVGALRSGTTIGRARGS